MISLIGLAIIAGFASQEFTEKLKVAASALFGASLKIEEKKTVTPKTISDASEIESLEQSGQGKNQSESGKETVTYTLRNRD